MSVVWPQDTRPAYQPGGWGGGYSLGHLALPLQAPLSSSVRCDRRVPGLTLNAQMRGSRKIIFLPRNQPYVNCLPISLWGRGSHLQPVLGSQAGLGTGGHRPSACPGRGHIVPVRSPQPTPRCRHAVCRMQEPLARWEPALLGVLGPPPNPAPSSGHCKEAHLGWVQP